jgi:hypothetical protein
MSSVILNYPIGKSYGRKNFDWEINRQKVWLYVLAISKKTIILALVRDKNNFYNFCTSFLIPSGWSSRKRLSPSAIPSLNLPDNHSDVWTMDKRSKRFRSVFRRQSASWLPTISVHINQLSESIFPDIEAAQTLLTLSKSNENCHKATKRFVNIGVQTDFSILHSNENLVTTPEVTRISNLIENEQELALISGINSCKLFDTIVSLVISTNESPIHSLLSPHKRVLLTLMKLKLDVAYSDLAALFHLSSRTCKTIFYNTVSELSIILKRIIHLPPLDELKNRLSECFLEFDKVRLVLDTVEILVQSNPQHCCQTKTYSRHKGTTTVKFMTGISPTGVINFVSPAYGGRVSDKIIFEQSKLIKKLDMYKDEIITDRGFLVKEICDNHNIRLIQSSSKKYNVKEDNLKIAEAHCHIERTSQRVRAFKMLSNRLPSNLIPLSEDIVTVVCGIVNMSNPYLINGNFLKLLFDDNFVTLNKDVSRVLILKP